MLTQQVWNEPEVFLVRVPFANVVTTETNIYIIRDGADVLVVDMGAPTEEAAQVLLDALDELAIDIKDARFFFTHVHFDHAGLAPKLIDHGQTIYINNLEMRAASPSFAEKMKDYARNKLISEGMSYHKASEICAIIELATSLNDGTFNIEETKAGDFVDVGRFSFKVIGFPGHTRGMQGLYDPKSKICFSGDQLLFIITPTTGIFLDGTDSIQAYENSMNDLLNLDISKLFHSHGDIRDDFKERGQAILAARDVRLGLAVEAVERLTNERLLQDACIPGMQGSEEDFPTGLEIIKEMGWKIPFASIDDCGLRQQWLIYIQGAAVLDHLVTTGRLQRFDTPALEGDASIIHRYAKV